MFLDGYISVLKLVISTVCSSPDNIIRGGFPPFANQFPAIIASSSQGFSLSMILGFCATFLALQTIRAG